ncbi:MAG: PilZ domain-containing protein [Elusimicrobia bacterium]|nr:PilZ domain-containing protein [Elusimicrobiota bacterium]
MSDKDKRQARRDKHDSVIEILDANGKFTASGRLSDYSETGASFTICAAAALPEKFRARLRLLGKGVLEVEARVIRTSCDKNAVCYGVKFEKVKTVYPSGELRNDWK